MACRSCSRVTKVLARYPAGDPRGSLNAAEAAHEECERTGRHAHVHYVPGRDEFAVVIGDTVGSGR
ncbi:hypothetical protein OK074_2678 [Actinobacteria bacterium OK074]|nr:hypothetical protein OK074_2678 [Actinobacteria bacterium OK074]